MIPVVLFPTLCGRSLNNFRISRPEQETYIVKAEQDIPENDAVITKHEEHPKVAEIFCTWHVSLPSLQSLQPLYNSCQTFGETF